MPTVDQILEVVGAVSALCTALALVFPKGSKLGAFFATIGADLKGHLS